MHEEINHFRFNDDDSPLSLEISGVSYCDGTYKIVRRKSSISVIEYIEEGSGTIIMNGQKYTAKKGDVYILPAGVRHEYYSSIADPWVKKFFNIKGTLFLELLRVYGLDNVVVIKNCDVKKQFDELYTMSRTENESQYGFYDTLALKLHELLISVKNFAFTSGGDDELLKVKAYIDQNLERIISNDELSGMIFRSNDYLIKSFRQRFGKTPYEYQIDRKMIAAKRLLQYTGLSVSDISQRLGYSDQHYFSNLFKQKCGMSPLSYRKTKK